MKIFSLRRETLCGAALLALFAASLASGAALAGSADPEDVIEARGEAAQRVLSDTSYRDKWSAPERIRSEQLADQAIREGNEALEVLEKAFADAKAACMQRFLVNSCIDDAKKLSFERQREIRRVIVTAEEFKRGIRTKALEEKREKAQKEPKKAPLDIRPKSVKTERPEPLEVAPKTVKEKKAPLDIAPKSVKAPSEPVDWKPREPKSPSEPAGIRPKTVKPASAPSGIKPKTEKPASAPSGLEPKAVKPASQPAYPPHDDAADAAQASDDDAERRAELERANEAYYNDKQAAAEKRMAEAAERAQKRKKEREARQQKFEATLQERVEAQKRYEEGQKNKDSGLSKFF